MITYPTDRLQKVLLSGGCEQRNLPSGYTQVDGVKNTNADQYIELNTTLTQDDEIEIIFSFSISGLVPRQIFGSRINASTNNISVAFSTTVNKLVIDFNNSDYTNYRLMADIVPNTIYKVLISKNRRAIYQGSILIAENTTVCNDKIIITNPLLYYVNGNPALTFKFIDTIYSLKINGKRHLISCTDSTNVGFYDKVTDSMFTLTDCTAGSVTVPTPNNPMDIVCNNGVLKVDSQGNIYTDGTQEVVTDSLGNTANAERLLAIGNYKDTQEVLSGSVTRNLDILVLKGDETNLQYYGKYNNVNLFYIDFATGQKIINSIAPLSTHYNSFLGTAETMPDVCVRYQGILSNSKGKNINRIYISDDRFDNLADYKTWLTAQYTNGTPVIIIRHLGTSATETVSGQFLSKSPVIQTAGNINNLPIKTDIHANMKHRFITDANGKSRLVNKVYVGSDLIFKETEIVDMGLPSGTLWASRNIDVTQPDGFAASPFLYDCSFFSWGNINGHNSTSNDSFAPYDWGSANAQEPWYEGLVYGSTPGNTLTDNIAVGEDFDAARVNLGVPWRIPTNDEYGELFNNIKYINADGTEVDITNDDKRVVVNGTKGLYLQSKINGARLFFSCSGYGHDAVRAHYGSNGYYWSSTWYSSRNALGLRFSGSVVYSLLYTNYRCLGFAIRAVI